MVDAPEDSTGTSRSAFSPLCHRARQLNARPERKRFFVSFTPVGEMATVNGSPSISISRRISFKSLVAIPFILRDSLKRSAPALLTWCQLCFSLAGLAPSLRARGEDVLRVPLPIVLLEAGITDETGFDEHHMSGLQNTLQMRGIPLHKWQHVAQPLQ